MELFHTGQVVTCTRTDALNAGAAFLPITLTVNVSDTATTPIVNSAVVSGGGETNTTNNTANDSTVINAAGGVPDLTIAKSHSGSFSQGQTGATYTITPTNSGTAATSGTVTVTDTVPAGMTPVGAVGTGWSCTISGQTLTCTRSNSLNAGSSFPAITLTVNVAMNAATPIVNSATVAGGGQTNTTNDTANDSTVITALPDMIVTKTHVGSFMQGQTGATYTLTARNIGTASVGAQVTVSDNLPAGLTATAISGTNWTCNLSSLTCTRNTGTFTLATNTNYEPITITVNVDANAPSSVTNFANVSGGGEVNTANDNASDITNINPTGVTAPDMTIAKSHTGNFTQGQTGATYNLTVTNSGNAATSGVVTITDSPFPVGLTATAISGTGWSCNLSTLTCTRSDVLAIGASYPVITVTANVASNALANITNTANVSGGGETNTNNNIATDPTMVNPSGALPDMTVTKTHVGNFSQGQSGATYTLTARNSGAGTSTGTVSVTDTLPSGLTATAISGSGWVCNLGSLTCTRSDALAASTSYPPITVTVNVAGNANPIINNSVSVSGGGETNTSNNNASDSTTITPAPDLVINKSHIGNFQQGQNGATYTLTATNQGGSPTSGVVTVTDTLPASLTATAISGSGWTCNLGTLSCTRSDVLNGSSSYPPITLTVNVASNAPSGIINIGNVSGGSESNTANNSASDLTTVNTTGGTPDLTVAKSHIGNFQQFQTGATYTLTVTNSGTAATNGTPVSLTDTLPTGLTATSISGAGWACNLGSLTCTRSDALNAGSSFPPITLTVNVAGNAPANITNTANTNGGGETNTTNNSASDPTTITTVPDLTITKSHSGNFTQGQIGVTYSLAISNVGSAASSGTYTMVDTLPTGLTPTAATGTGWTCGISGQTVTCTRANAIAVNAAAQVITITANVSSTATTPLINTASISGGSEMNPTNNSSSDPTTINPTGGAVDLVIAKSHSGNFTQGQTGATYNLTVTNNGTISSSGNVSVVENPPAGLTLTAISGTGWSCTLATRTCTRSDALNSTATYPPITATVTVAAAATSPLINNTTVSGGGDSVTTNNAANDSTIINASGGTPDFTIAKSHTGNFTQGQTGATYSITATNSGTAPSTGTVTVVENPPTGLTLTAIAGTGWTCTLGTRTCTRADVLSAGASYPPIVATLSVAANAALGTNSLTNNATVAGGGQTNTTNDAANDPTTILGVPDVAIAKSHVGNFSQGQSGATYTIIASNAGTGATTGIVTVADSLPSGMTPTAASGTGWSCNITGQNVSCARSDALANGANFPAITILVNVSGTASGTLTNVATISGGGETNTGNNNSSDPTTVNGTPDLTIVKSHTGNFTQSQTNALYALAVTNSGSGPTSGVVSVNDNVPAGLTPTAAAGTGWSCSISGQNVNCTRSDSINAGISYPPISLTVSVAGNAPNSLTNSATVSGGGETNTTNNTFNDVTNINQVPDLTIAKSHAGSFIQGQTGANYAINVSNIGAAPTNASVIVTDTLPASLTPTSASGSGWSCTVNGQAVTCSRNDFLASGASYPEITILVNVAASAPANVTNTASVSGGGDTTSANNSANDPTTINPPNTPDLTVAKSHAGNFSIGQIGAVYLVTVSNSGTGITTSAVTMNDTIPTGLTPISASGTGWTCNITGQLVSCSRSDSLATGLSYPSVSVGVNIENTVPLGTNAVTNIASVNGGGETNTVNNSANDPTTISALVAPSVSLVKSVLPAGAQPPGTDLTYKIIFQNEGGSAARNLVITDPVPANTDFKIGSPELNLGTTGMTFSTEYSNDGGTTWTYVPVSGGGGAATGYDRSITHIRWKVTTGNLSYIAPNNVGDIAFAVKIRS